MSLLGVVSSLLCLFMMKFALIEQHKCNINDADGKGGVD